MLFPFTFFFLHSAISFLLWYYTTPLIMKFIPPSPISNFGVLSSFFSSCLPELPARVALSFICRSLVNSNGLQQSLQLHVSCCQATCLLVGLFIIVIVVIIIRKGKLFVILQPFQTHFHYIICFSSKYRKTLLRGVKEQSKWIPLWHRDNVKFVCMGTAIQKKKKDSYNNTALCFVTGKALHTEPHPDTKPSHSLPSDWRGKN